MNANLRKIEAIPPIPGMVIASSAGLGSRPELRWVKPTSILVDENYQRDLSKRSYALIRTMMQNFAWRKMKPPIVVEVDKGLHCVDGQHTAIAAASIGVKEIPVFIVDGSTTTERADSFIAHNRDRIVMQPLDIYRARIAAGDPDALGCHRVCESVGVRIRQIQPNGKILIGDTSAVGTIQRLVKRRGMEKSRAILQGFVDGGRGPITPAEIDAAEALMVVARPKTTTEQFARVVRAVGDRGVLNAKIRGMTEQRPQKHILLTVYRDLLDKQFGVKPELERA